MMDQEEQTKPVEEMDIKFPSNLLPPVTHINSKRFYSLPKERQQAGDKLYKRMSLRRDIPPT